MRPALVTILPMLSAAILVMVGGAHMAKRDTEIRTPADRERLLDLADSFSTELERLDALYLGHLDSLANRVIYEKEDQATAAAKQVSGVSLIRVFKQKGKDLTIYPISKLERLPEIELEKRKRPFDPKNAVILDESLLDTPLPTNGTWMPSTDPGMRLHLLQPEPGVLVVFLIDLVKVRELTSAHMAEWISLPLTPLKEADERVEIEPPKGLALASIGPERHGPAASILPTRTLFGDWQIRAWDGLTVTRSYDTATLAIAATLALLLALSGIILFLEQKRALKLASKRVSFVNRVSHELGTPLTNLTLNLDLATEDFTTRPVESRRRLALVTEEVERLSRLVANVLTFSRHERDSLKLKPSRCLPEEIINQTLDNFRPALERRGITIETDISANTHILVDPDALSQITGNLLSNVEKYASSGKWLSIVARLEMDFLILEIRDKGSGIPASASQKIFKPFERVLDNTNEGASGTGLGLSIARDLASRMGGTLELLDTEKGAAFCLRIPAPSALTIIPDQHIA